MIDRLFAAALLLLAPSAIAADLADTPSPAVSAPQNADAQPSNAEMTAIFDADQAVRKAPPTHDSSMSDGDRVRRQRTRALLDAGALHSGEDFFHAAFVFQHGDTPDDYIFAHLLATIAVARGHSEATWISAATLDRYLMSIGQPQLLGTQYRTQTDGTMTQEPYARQLASDALRAALRVPPLAQQETRRKEMEKNIVPLAPRPRLFSGTLAPRDCPAIAGTDAVLARPGLRWLVVGELTGSNEMPVLFADLVCQASRTHAVAVAVPLSGLNQSAIDAFIASDGGAEAVAALGKAAHWEQTRQFGQSSQALFRLFEQLRQLRVAGRISAVVAAGPLIMLPAGGPRPKPGDYEAGMAKWLEDRAPADGLVLVLTDPIHSRLTPPPGAQPDLMPMAHFLPADRTVTLQFRSNGGSHWGCSAPGTCGPQPAPSGNYRRGVTLGNLADGSFSGTLDLGAPVTVSPPQ